MALMDLPMELLVQILEEVGGSHLRRGNGIKRLTLCRKWYAAAQRIYLSGLETTSINLYGSSLEDLDSKYGYSGLRPLMYKNTRSLRLRLLGHFWDENTAEAYENKTEDRNTPSGTSVRNQAPFNLTALENQRALENWRDGQLRPHLDDLFDDLGNFAALETVILEASSDSAAHPEDTPHWNYVYASSVVRLLANLPIIHDLSHLTLDLCGMENGLLNDDDTSAYHLCHALSDVIPRIETVRIRIPQICPAVFRLPKMNAEDVKLTSLSIKLHLPNFSNTMSPWVKACANLKDQFNRLHIHEHMAQGAASFLGGLGRLRNPGKRRPHPHGMTGCRISFVYRPTAPRVTVLDCLTGRMLWPAEEFLWYDDDGTPCWFEFDDEKAMLDQGPLK